MNLPEFKELVSKLRYDPFIATQAPISFTVATVVEGVKLPKNVKERFPINVGLIFQHQFKNLECFKDGFKVDLMFQRVWHECFIPWVAVTGFEQTPLVEVVEEDDERAVGDGEGEDTNVVCFGDWKKRKGLK